MFSCKNTAIRLTLVRKFMENENRRIMKIKKNRRKITFPLFLRKRIIDNMDFEL